MAYRLAEQHAAVIAGVVRLLTPRFPDLDEATRETVQRDVTAFVASQVRAIPSFMRFPYLLALTGFDWLPLVRYGRPFRALSPATQAAYLSVWSNAPLGVMRDFVKLLRSCALLAYFDHPRVRQQLDAAQASTAPAAASHRVIQIR